MARLLFDHNVPVGLRSELRGHHVMLAREIGLAQVGNGVLIAAAEAAGFEILVTADKNLAYQQNLTNRTIAILVLGTYHWRTIRERVAEVVRAIDQIPPGGFAQLDLARSRARS